MKTKRLRIFAGPNGSGKSTLKRDITGKFNIPFGYFVNADEIERALREQGFFDFSPTKITVSKEEFAIFCKKSSLAERAGMTDWVDKIDLADNRLKLSGTEVNSYHAALVADFLREKLVEAGETFSIETVLSDHRKIDFIKKAKLAGFRIYVYFVATDNPEVNLKRVAARVLSGGHGVSAEKVLSRYEKALALLPEVVNLSDRAYIFDNSHELELIAEVTDGIEFEYKNGDIPAWVHRTFGG